MRDPEIEPTEPGFYKYSGGRNAMLFLLDHSAQWWVVFDSGFMEKCVWEYIEQALAVWDLEKIE